MSSYFKAKAEAIGRTAFITHVDGKKLAGKGYEAKIWFQRDIDELQKDIEIDIKDKLKALHKNRKEYISILASENEKLEAKISKVNALLSEYDPIDRREQFNVDGFLIQLRSIVTNEVNKEGTK